MKITCFLEFIVLLQFNAITCIKGCDKVSGKKIKYANSDTSKAFILIVQNGEQNKSNSLNTEKA